MIFNTINAHKKLSFTLLLLKMCFHGGLLHKVSAGPNSSCRCHNVSKSIFIFLDMAAILRGVYFVQNLTSQRVSKAKAVNII